MAVIYLNETAVIYPDKVAVIYLNETAVIYPDKVAVIYLNETPKLLELKNPRRVRLLRPKISERLSEIIRRWLTG